MNGEKDFNVRVYGLLIDEHKRILLSDEERNGTRFIKFPGGGLEFGEGLLEGLKREFLEECNLQVQVERHFYTTDFFVASAFGGGQLISVYYLVKPLHDFGFKLAACAYDFGEQKGDEKQCFRMVPLADLGPGDLTFPVDQHVVQLLKPTLQ